MPRFFFTVHDDLEALDDEGLEFAGVEAARVEAIKSARALVCESVSINGRIVLDHSIEVTDEQGVTVSTIRFGDVVNIIS
jgi:hypothetical protein